MRKPIFTLIAGINGAGKTTLYFTLTQEDSLGERINIDEIVKEQGDWRDNKLQILAGREALKKIHDCIEQKVSFHTETTLPGHSIVRLIERAKENGFEIHLYFVGVESVEVALERVRRRMELGGHGLSENALRLRYKQLLPNLKKILPLCDRAVMFDNTVQFRKVAVLYENRLVNCEHNLPGWFIEIMDGIRVQG